MTDTMTSEPQPWEFPVGLTKVHYEGHPDVTHEEAKNYRAVVRFDTGELLAVVSRDYELIPHKEVIELCDTYYAGQDVSRKVKLTRNGARMFASYIMKDMKVNIGTEDEPDMVSPRVTITNSYDASMRIWVEAGAWRLVCTNGLKIGKTLIKRSRKHVGTEALDDLLDHLEETMEVFNSVIPVWQQWGRETILLEEGDEIIGNLGLPEKYTEMVKDEWRNADRNTLWNLYNAVTYVMTHGTDVSVERQRQLERTSIDGLHDEFTNRGFPMEVAEA